MDDHKTDIHVQDQPYILNDDFAMYVDGPSWKE